MPPIFDLCVLVARIWVADTCADIGQRARVGTPAQVERSKLGEPELTGIKADSLISTKKEEFSHPLFVPNAGTTMQAVAPR